MEESVTGVRKGRNGTPVSQRTLVMETGAVIGADQDRAGVSPSSVADVTGEPRLRPRDRSG